jgi:adenylylsulfate kinase-like enzyme
MTHSGDPENGAVAVWLFGLPCAGKSTLAAALTARWRGSTVERF